MLSMLFPHPHAQKNVVAATNCGLSTAMPQTSCRVDSLVWSCNISHWSSVPHWMRHIQSQLLINAVCKPCTRHCARTADGGSIHGKQSHGQAVTMLHKPIVTFDPAWFTALQIDDSHDRKQMQLAAWTGTVPNSGVSSGDSFLLCDHECRCTSVGAQSWQACPFVPSRATPNPIASTVSLMPASWIAACKTAVGWARKHGVAS